MPPHLPCLVCLTTIFLRDLVRDHLRDRERQALCMRRRRVAPFCGRGPAERDAALQLASPMQFWRRQFGARYDSPPSTGADDLMGTAAVLAILMLVGLYVISPFLAVFVGGAVLQLAARWSIRLETGYWKAVLANLLAGILNIAVGGAFLFILDAAGVVDMEAESGADPTETAKAIAGLLLLPLWVLGHGTVITAMFKVPFRHGLIAAICHYLLAAILGLLLAGLIMGVLALGAGAG